MGILRVPPAQVLHPCYPEQRTLINGGTDGGPAQ